MMARTRAAQWWDDKALEIQGYGGMIRLSHAHYRLRWRMSLSDARKALNAACLLQAWDHPHHPNPKYEGMGD
jgi:hypothetical protein